MSLIIPRVMVSYNTDYCSVQTVNCYSIHFKTSMSVLKKLTTVTQIMVSVLTYQEISLALVMLDLPEMASVAMVTTPDGLTPRYTFFFV